MRPYYNKEINSHNDFFNYSVSFVAAQTCDIKQQLFLSLVAMNYLPFIDGLRAVAILLVLLFHAGIHYFPSGFIGVDVFFVISGFLITSIIINSLGKGNFSFARFYSRRLWRLQPVFICLLVVTTLLASLYCVPDDLIQYGKSLRKTSLYVSNVFFSNLTTGYFAPDGKQLPLLHTWSLSIEWQCYLILPLALFLLSKRFAREKLGKIIYWITLAALGIALYSSFYDSAYTYYLLSSRIFEFLIGACVTFNNSRLTFNKHFLNGLSLLALFSLVYIATLEKVSIGFPNAYALIVCFAAAILILAGNINPSTFAVRILSFRPLVFIGLISYSLYIWHWPIFAFSRYLGLEESVFILAIQFALTFSIAYCSWRFIEKPARAFNSLPILQTVSVLLIVPILLIHVGAYEIKKHEGYPVRFAKMSPVFSTLKNYNSEQREACLVFKDTEVSAACTIGVNEIASKTGLMFGDSFSNHYWKFIDQLAKDAQLSVLAQAMGSCLALPGIHLTDFSYKLYTECKQQTERYYAMVKKNHYDYVIIGESWSGYTERLLTAAGKPISASLAEKQIENALDSAIQFIVDAGSRPVLIKAIPLSPKGDPYLCYLTHLKRGLTYNPQDCNYDVNAATQSRVNALFAKMEEKYPQLIIIDPQKLLCKKGHCSADINNIPVFRDMAHLTDYASYQLGKAYLAQYKNPFIG